MRISPVAYLLLDMEVMKAANLIDNVFFDWTEMVACEHIRGPLWP